MINLVYWLFKASPCSLMCVLAVKGSVEQATVKTIHSNDTHTIKIQAMGAEPPLKYEATSSYTFKASISNGKNVRVTQFSIVQN